PHRPAGGRCTAAPALEAGRLLRRAVREGVKRESRARQVGPHAHPAFPIHLPLPPLAGEGWDGGTRRRGGRHQRHPLAPTPTLPRARGRESWPRGCGRSQATTSAGTRTQPSISTRALRLITAFVTLQRPSTCSTEAPTCRVPEGCPKRTTSRRPPPAARFTRVPGTAAAVAIATDAVPIIAWCSLPIDSARTLRSMSAAAIALPLEAT